MVVGDKMCCAYLGQNMVLRTGMEGIESVRLVFVRVKTDGFGTIEYCSGKCIMGDLCVMAVI